MTILCLCREAHHWKLIPGYAEAFRRQGIAFVCVDDSLPFDAPLDEVVRHSGVTPSAVFHFESAHPLFPIGLERCEVPTVCFHPDTYAFTERRIRWSAPFDHVAVFHPGYVERFARKGHPGAFLLPHAVRREFFGGPEPERSFELGWVGQTSGPFYQTRARWLPALAKEFRTNDWSRDYTVREVADTYRRSKIVVNIGRDDFPQDANLRVFEGLASGALLLTSLPTELAELGFTEGRHFVGYRNPADLPRLVRSYLEDEAARSRIALAARERVLEEHTYDQRASQILARLRAAGGAQQAPARRWPESRARLAALDFYAGHGLTDCAANQFRRIAGRGFRETMEGATLLARAWLNSNRAR
jgi:glycosyltransferase involved in cell wall biosynthesis